MLHFLAMTGLVILGTLLVVLTFMLYLGLTGLV